MKKILLLGGSTQQIPAIEYANKKGYYTVLCDYLSDNPGQHYAKKYYCVSTTDKGAILNIAKKEKVDGIVAYASDPAAPTAAYVAEKMGLPSNPLKSVEILAYKDKFREFLKANNFNCPHAESYANYGQAKKSIYRFKFPVMVKPVDSSGSKGVNKVESIVEFELALNLALDNSRSKNIIVEEFITQDHPYMIAGDCFVVDGKVQYWGFLNSHRDLNVNPFVPVGTSYPIFLSLERLSIAKETIQRLFDLLGIRFGAFNIEIVFDEQDKPYLIEIGPRNGGNMIPDLLFMATGDDLIAATIESAMGNNYIFKNMRERELFLSTHVLHADKNGILKDIIFDKEIKKHTIKKVIYKEFGDRVQFFDGANKAIGIVFLKFGSMEQMLDMMDHSNRFINVIVE